MDENKNFVLSDVEARVLGCLIEKSITTPDYYPMSLNALMNACNQKSNRDPVVSYDDDTVMWGIDHLKEYNLACQIISDDQRVPKYKHNLFMVLKLNHKQAALLCVLLLRGPQTAGELRIRTERMADFTSLEEIESTLEELANYSERPLALKLPRQPGRKECRYITLLTEYPDINISESNTGISSEEKPRPVESPVKNLAGKVEILESEIALLKNEIENMRKDFREFKKQFE